MKQCRCWCPCSGQCWGSGGPQRGEKQQSYGQKARSGMQPINQEEKKKSVQRHCRQERWREENRHMANTAEQTAAETSCLRAEGAPTSSSSFHELSLPIPMRSPSCQQWQDGSGLRSATSPSRIHSIPLSLTLLPIGGRAGHRSLLPYPLLPFPLAQRLLEQTLRSLTSPSTAGKVAQKCIFPLPR